MPSLIIVYITIIYITEEEDPFIVFFRSFGEEENTIIGSVRTFREEEEMSSLVFLSDLLEKKKP